MAQRILHLPDELAARVLLAASRAYPNECCGLIEGEDTADGWRALAVHEAKNIADDPRRRFLIDPQAQFDLMRRLRGADTRIIGCFHSHPDGEAKPSATDRAEAYESDFVYLIAGGSPDVFTLKAYLFTDALGFTPPHNFRRLALLSCPFMGRWRAATWRGSSPSCPRRLARL